MRRYEKAAETLGAWMQQRAVGAGQLARQTGIDTGILRRILSGRQQEISTRNMLALARFFDVSLRELIDTLT